MNRSNKTRWTTIVLLSLVAGLNAAEKYSIKDLGTIGGSQCTAYGLNDFGDVVGVAGTANGTPHAFFYSNGTMTDLTPSSLGESDAYGINNSRQVVGMIRDPITWYAAAFLYDGNSETMIDLSSAIGGVLNTAWAINNSGLITGYFSTDGAVSQAFIYDSTQGKVVKIGGLMSDINDSGWTVGATADSYDHSHPVLDNQQQTIDLGTLGGANGSAVAINNLGAVVGSADTFLTSTSRSSYGFLWQDGFLQALPGLKNERSSSEDINDTGVVVGQSWFNASQRHAVLWEKAYPNTMVVKDLNDLIPQGTGWVLTDAHGINKYGQIVAQAESGNQQHVFLLTPKKLRYTATLSVPTDTTLPQGGGELTMQVTDAGKVYLDGRLGDGTPLHVVTTRANGAIQLHQKLYGGRGSLSGTITFDGDVVTEANGTLTWSRPTLAGSKYPAAFSTSVDFNAALYTENHRLDPFWPTVQQITFVVHGGILDGQTLKFDTVRVLNWATGQFELAISEQPPYKILSPLPGQKGIGKMSSGALQHATLIRGILQKKYNADGNGFVLDGGGYTVDSTGVIGSITSISH